MAATGAAAAVHGMLSGIHPVLSGELLLHLDRLGHGDEFAVVDANFPAYRCGTVVVELPGCSAATAVAAIRTVVPLDQAEGASALLMAGPEGEDAPASHALLRAALSAPAERTNALGRFAFYERVRSSRLVVRTGERGLFANVVLRKGVVIASAVGSAAD